MLDKYHYLHEMYESFRTGYNFGLFKDNYLIGVVIYSSLGSKEAVKSAFGNTFNNQKGILELSRLCIHPEYQIKNLASYFVSNTIKLLKKECALRAIISYSDSELHKGIVYQACNFKYYGLNPAKKDFYVLNSKGDYVIQNRGKTKGVEGAWIPRSRKHRYMIVFDNTLKINWKQESYPK